MRNRIQVLVFVLLATTAHAQTKLSLVPRVDERVELLSIVFRLAGNPEYSMNEPKAYTRDIDAYFAHYKDHPAVTLARQLRITKGVSYNAVMAMAVHLSEPPALSPVIPFTNQAPDARWGKADAGRFARLLRDFYRDTHFDKFFAVHRPMYEKAESSFQTVLSSVNLDWHRKFYGEIPNGNFRILLGMNNGAGNYGPKLVLPDGREELYAILGCWTFDNDGNPIYTLDGGYEGTIIHEFNHSFVNPLVDRNWKDLAAAETIYGPVSEKMKSLAYADARAMMYESLVRAAVILYFEAQGEKPAGLQRRARNEQSMGFLWMPGLCDLLRRYAADREHYPTLASYMPQVTRFYQDLAPYVAEKLATFNRNSAHVIALSPFANRAQDVDAATAEVTVVFDKPLDPAKGFSINPGPGGWEHNPVAGYPRFETDGKSITIPLKLKPNWTYGFALTSWAFATTDGYPLEGCAIEFKTK